MRREDQAFLLAFDCNSTKFTVDAAGKPESCTLFLFVSGAILTMHCSYYGVWEPAILNHSDNNSEKYWLVTQTRSNELYRQLEKLGIEPIS